MWIRSLLFVGAAIASALPAHNIHATYADGRRLPSAEPPVVEVRASNPSEMLDCLARHRITPLACVMLNNTEIHGSIPSSPPPPMQECGGTAPDAVCFYGRGRCAYDATRGWFCRCGVPKQVQSSLLPVPVPPLWNQIPTHSSTPFCQVARGVQRAVESLTLSPHCIED